MNIQRAIIVLILLGPLIVFGAAYSGLILDGTVAPPDLRAMAQSIVPAITGTFSFSLGLTIVVLVVCSAIAPLIFAARSGDVLTVLVSVVFTAVAIATFVTAKSAIQEILAVLIYLANTVLSATIYAAHFIARPRK